MRPGPVRVVRYLLSSHPVNAAPQHLIDVIVTVVNKMGWVSHPNLATERAETWEEGVDRVLRRQLNELQALGRPACITFNSSDSSYVQGACFIEPGDPPEIREQKRRRRRLRPYLDLIRGLSPDEFEILCQRLLSVLGVASPHLTRRTADEGIDFYGKLTGESVFFPHDLEPTVQRQLSIWLVGQAKQFVRSTVGTPEVRDLVGAVVLGRSGVFSTEASPSSELSIRVGDPVFLMLVTGGSLSGRAWKLVERSGIIGIDGEMLAAFLVDRDTTLGDDPDAAAFRRWLVSETQWRN